MKGVILKYQLLLLSAIKILTVKNRLIVLLPVHYNNTGIVHF